MTLPTVISAPEAKALLDRGTAILVDVREAAEHARESIPGSRSMPLSGFDAERIAGAAPKIIFHCQSGMRTMQNVGLLADCGGADIYLLEGGLNAWKSAGFPTVIDRTKPIEMQRQVQIAAGSLVLAGFALSFGISHWFCTVPALVGFGLVFAGVSGWCGMAKILAVMPWNQAAA